MSQISKAVEMAKKEGQFGNDRQQRNGGGQQPHLFRENDVSRIATDAAVLRKNNVLTGIDDNKVVDTYRLLRTRVLSRMRQNRWKSLGITSAGKNDGKTLTAVNLAISIAMKQNHSVVIVDTDLRNPSVAKAFGIEPKFGLADYLSSDVPLGKVLINPGIDGLNIIPGNQHTHTPSELLSSLKMSRLAKDLKSQYQSIIVIYDLPPVLVGDDVVAFAPNLDAVLFVVEEGSTDSSRLKKSVSLLEDLNIIGSVLNKSKQTSDQEGYYY